MYTIFEELSKFNNIVYQDAPHTYEINGKKATSVTTFLKKFEKPFEEMKWATKKANERGVDVSVILAEWAYKRDFSTVKGSGVHEYIEFRLANKVFPYDPTPSLKLLNDGTDPVAEPYAKNIVHANKFISDIQGKMLPIKSELIVGDEEHLICGMIDQLFYNKKSGMLEIWDWKTNGDLTTESKYRLLSPISHVPDSKLDIYSLQLNLYKYIIEKNTNLKIGNCYLVWFNEKNTNYVVYPCKDYQPEVVKMMQFA